MSDKPARDRAVKQIVQQLLSLSPLALLHELANDFHYVKLGTMDGSHTTVVVSGFELLSKMKPQLPPLEADTRQSDSPRKLQGPTNARLIDRRSERIPHLKDC